MEQWLELQTKFLHILLEMEGQPSALKCSVCGGRDEVKCPDCFRAPLFCMECCLMAHKHSPFHCPLLWTATHYTPVLLKSLGFVLFIGHDGMPCLQMVEVFSIPSFCYKPCSFLFRVSKLHQYQGLPKPLTAEMYTDTPSLLHPLLRIKSPWSLCCSFPLHGIHPSQRDHSIFQSSPTLFLTFWRHSQIPETICLTRHNKTYTADSGNPILTVVDWNGIFDSEVVFCVCSNSNARDEQLLHNGLFPSTFKSTKTVFTFSVLDDFLRDNLECKTTAQ
jgi:hypothetical protein